MENIPEITMLTVKTVERAEEADYRASLYAIEHREELEKMDMDELLKVMTKVMYPEAKE